jgi:glycosyltransferase involved in cell wall biosynthesis
VTATPKTVLILVHDFPPAGGAGVQRVLKFVKYLPEFGWRSVVVAATPESYTVLDNTLAADIPADTPILRVPSFDPNKLRPRCERLRLGKALSLFNAALFLPDAAFTWAYRARPVVKQAIRDYRPTVIFSSALPASAHMLGLWAQQATGLPWVTDFRDPWSENELQPYLPGYRALNRRLEDRVLAASSRILTVSPPLAEMFTRLCGDRARVRLIENGYDPEDVAVLPPPQTRRFTITYTGEFSRIRRPDAFIEAIDRLLAAGSIPPAEIRVAFAGKDTAKFVPDRPPYEQLGYLNHDELSALRRETDLLLLIHGDSAQSRGNYSGKIFEYLGCNRPTLAITGPANVAAELITRARAGTATSHDPDEIAAAVLGYYQGWKSGGFAYAPDWAVIQHFTRRNLTGLLAKQLAEVSET